MLGESHPAVAVTTPCLPCFSHQPSYSGVRCRRGRESTEESGEIKHKSNFFHWASRSSAAPLTLGQIFLSNLVAHNSLWSSGRSGSGGIGGSGSSCGGGVTITAHFWVSVSTEAPSVRRRFRAEQDLTHSRNQKTWRLSSDFIQRGSNV